MNGFFYSRQDNSNDVGQVLRGGVESGGLTGLQNPARYYCSFENIYSIFINGFIFDGLGWESGLNGPSGPPRYYCHYEKMCSIFINGFIPGMNGRVD